MSIATKTITLEYIYHGILLSPIIFLVIYTIIFIIRRKKPSKSKTITPDQIFQPQKTVLKNTASQNIDHFFKDKDFVNKNITQLSDFIINAEINHYDLEKLAQLNGISIDIGKGWYDLTLELMKELHALGWQGKVACIKEKYMIMSLKTCEECGNVGSSTFW